jgi:hypothetical protein
MGESLLAIGNDIVVLSGGLHRQRVLETDTEG